MENPEASWKTPPEPVPESRLTAIYEADVVILGAGHAGTSAARAAAEARAQVAVLEMQSEDRFSVFGGQYGSINSRFMQAKGVPYYDPIGIMRDWQHRSLNRANPDLIRKFAYTNGDTFDWFLEPVSQELKDAIRVFMWPQPKGFTGELNGFKSFVGTAMFGMGGGHGGPPPDGGPGGGPPGEGGHGGPPDEGPPGADSHGGPPSGGPPPMEGQGGRPRAATSLTDAVIANQNRAKALGAEFYYGMFGNQLVQDETGRVTGIIVTNFKKEYFLFKARKGVILASGDFSGNRQMMLDLLQELTDLTDGGKKHVLYGGGRNGIGHRMGLWAGGVMEPGPKGGMWCCVAGTGGPMEGTAFLKLNSHGKRYGNEGIYGYWGQGLQGARQPDGPIYTLWDADWKSALECQSLDHSSIDPNEAGMIEMRLRRCLESGGLDNSYNVSGPPAAYQGQYNRLAAADTIEGLADKLGLAAEARANFIAAVDRYNALCAKGRDEDYAKDERLLTPVAKPPFYCFEERYKAVGNVMVTVAGLMVDGDQQVLNKSYEPIGGLFATGNCSGGRFPLMYTTPVAGVSIGMAHALGRLAGDCAARR